MSAEGGDNTIVDKALESGKKAASAVGSGIKKATNMAADKISAAKGSTLITIMRWGDVILAIALILCYPIGIATHHTTISFTLAFMMVYCIVFSILLIIFEIGLGKFDGFIRKYFGFMYSYMGRTIFTLFTVAMVFGSGSSEEKIYTMNLIVGCIGIVFCIFSCFVVCKHPAFQKGGEFYTDGSNTGVSEAPAKKPTAAAPKAVAAAPAYESNPFESSSDDDIPAASVPGERRSSPKPSKAKKAKKAKKIDDNPFEDDNPFDD